ncbi:MAG: hypothetical protein GY697_01405 [Desulfobacterales bacterium]|nr:hypothetical protein [Desulfobacterales bacterium]
MQKRELIKAYEKAKTQTKGQAGRILDQLSGVVGDPLNEKEPEEVKPEKQPSSQADPEQENPADIG